MFAFSNAEVGYSFFLKDGYPSFAYKYKYASKTAVSNIKVKPGNRNIKAEFAFDKETKTTTVSLYIDDTKVLTENIGVSQVLPFTTMALQIGRNWGKAVSNEYKSPLVFNGVYKKASIDLFE